MERTDPRPPSTPSPAGRRSLDEPAGPDARPRTATVLVWFTVAAVIVSYLCAYALTNALVASELIQRWPRDHDPRPKWMLVAFTGLWSLFAAACTGMRWISRRQLLGIDAITRESE
jgi:hypothetical protein